MGRQFYDLIGPTWPSVSYGCALHTNGARADLVTLISSSSARARRVAQQRYHPSKPAVLGVFTGCLCPGPGSQALAPSSRWPQALSGPRPFRWSPAWGGDWRWQSFLGLTLRLLNLIKIVFLWHPTSISLDEPLYGSIWWVVVELGMERVTDLTTASVNASTDRGTFWDTWGYIGQTFMLFCFAI